MTHDLTTLLDAIRRTHSECEALAAFCPVADDVQETPLLPRDNTRSTGVGGAFARDGLLYAPDAPDLGVVPDFDALGMAVAEYAV